MRRLTENQARFYIMGEEQFDETEWEREHIIRLTKTIQEMTNTIKPECYQNAIHTAEKYILNHANTVNRTEFLKMKQAFNKMLYTFNC